VLETSRRDLPLETVKSRCVSVRFERLSAQQTREVLEREGLGGEQAGQLALWAQGSPGRALALAREGAPRVRALLAAVLEGELDPLEACAGVLEAPGEFDGKTAAAQKRSRGRAALDLACALLRDGLAARVGVPVTELAHGDLVEGSSREESSWRIALERVVALRGELELNLAPEGILDRALLALSGERASPRTPTRLSTPPCEI